ncbi:MAG: TonB-dependent receptor [Acidobacteriia bacterium]|nr:TonB-dependent receptor [Terriglobia bacterium]
MNGTITGTISDPAGAVVPGAAIQVKNTDTGAVFAGGTSATGNYVVSLPPGKYELDVTVPGFKKFIRQNLQITSSVDTRLDVTLDVGAATESVTVEAAAPLLKTESGEVSHSVTGNDADELPVLSITGATAILAGNGFGNIRDPLAVSLLVPGVNYAVDGGITVNGLPASSEAIRIEGQDATNGTWNQKTQINQSGMDAIQEVSIQTSNFAAEYGQAGGGYFNYTMKSGTNQLHGSAYLYSANDALNAGLPFTDAGITNSQRAGQHVRNADRKFDFGGTIGGPVVIPKVYDGKDKSFFFFNFERYQENQSFTPQETVPTAAERGGDFSGILNPFGLPFPLALSSAGFFGPPSNDALGRPMFYNEIYDPNTTRTLTSGAIVRDPFPNFHIDPTRFNPVASAIQNLIPQANAPGLKNNFNLGSYSDYQHTTNWSIKADHSFSPTIKISGYFSHILTFNPNLNGIPGPVEQPSATNNSSSTVRINYDQTLRPTLLLHLGVGYIHTYIPSGAANYNENSLGLTGYPVSNYFPNVTGLSDFFTGGVSLAAGPFGGGTIGPAGFLQDVWDEKPTANANLTWVKGNHTYKFGGEMMIEGFPDKGVNRANGNFGISPTETGNPDEQRVGLSGSTGTTGFGYASFLLGQVDNLNINPATQSKLGYHSFAFYAQDSWKVTRKLTLDYGLRYDFESYLKEQYGRMPNTVFNVMNPVTNTPGATLFEGYGGGRCNCAFSHSYPFAFGPRLGVAYQVTPKTVLRGGVALQYAQASNNAFLSYNDTVFYAVSGPSYGQPFMTLGPNPYAPGNPFGNPALVYPNFNAGVFPVPTGGLLPPDSPFINIDRSSRPPRIFNWSFGLQREITPNLVAEATYVGNRGVWWTAPELDATDYNALQPSDLARWGLNIHNPADQQLLLTPINSPAVVARFPQLANPNNVYKGFPGSQPLNQVIRLAPQFLGVPPFLGPPLGDTWYDSLQVKVTKRFSHGLSIQGSYTYSKNEVLGVSASTQYFTPGTPLVNDVYNRGINKQLAQNTTPSLLIVSGMYVTPRWGQNRLVKNVVGGWQIAAVLRYQNGALIQTPPSVNNLLTELDRGPSNNPALWGGGNTFWNPVQGQSCLSVDPNQKGFDPSSTLALNPKAWVDPGPGNFGAAAPFYNNCRWQRQPQESMSFGRNFRIKERGNLQFRIEFQNVFNRLFYSMPSVGSFGATNPTTPATNTNPNNGLSGGYGFVPYINGVGDTPRTAQAVIRFTF